MAITLVGAAAAQSGDQKQVTTGAIDSSGADALVLFYAHTFTFYYSPSAFSDSKGNTWTFITSAQYNNGGPGSRCELRLYYCVAPVVGSGHTASAGIAGQENFPSVGLSAWTGVTQTSPVDASYAANHQEFYPSGSVYGGGSTPSANNALVVGATTFEGNVTGTAYLASGGGAFAALHSGYSPSNGRPFSAQYSVQTTATSVAIYWTHSDYVNSSPSCVVMADLFAATAGGGALAGRPYLVPQARVRASYW